MTKPCHPITFLFGFKFALFVTVENVEKKYIKLVSLYDNWCREIVAIFIRVKLFGHYNEHKQKLWSDDYLKEFAQKSFSLNIQL